MRVLATDISTKALETAKQAVYPAEKLAGFPDLVARRYFLRGEHRWKGWFRARSQLREMVEFRRMNLTEPFPALPKFAVIFCRNVMIYFDRATQAQLVNRLAQCLEAGGYLFTGHSESLLRGSHALEYIRPAIYRKPGGGPRTTNQARSSRCAP